MKREGKMLLPLSVGWGPGSAVVEQLERTAIRRAFIALSLFSFRRRRIPLPIRFVMAARNT
jgi:hypothetical protein